MVNDLKTLSKIVKKELRSVSTNYGVNSICAYKTFIYSLERVQRKYAVRNKLVFIPYSMGVVNGYKALNITKRYYRRMKNIYGSN